MEIRTFIRSVLKEAFSGLDEAMINSSTIEPGIGLFIKAKQGVVDFTLYDPTQNKIYGHMGIHKLSSGNWAVGGIGTEYGYGPLMYEMAMSYVYPNALMPTRDGDVRGGAIDVWRKFLKRKDVNKVRLTKKDRDFSFDTYEDMGNGPDVRFIQTKYYYDGAKGILNDLKKKGIEYLKQGSDLNAIDRMGNEFWFDKYDE
jgi:hypothetical protein